MLISADSKGAVLEIDGKRQTLEMGQHFETAAMTGGAQERDPARRFARALLRRRAW